MNGRSINVRVVKETSKTVTIKILSLNRKMPVAKKDFEKRVESGVYNVIPAITAPSPKEEETSTEENTNAVDNNTSEDTLASKEELKSNNQVSEEQE